MRGGFIPKERPIRRDVLTIDAGSMGTGLALWDGDDWKSGKPVVPTDTRILTPRKHKEFEVKIGSLSAMFSEFLDEAPSIKSMYCEYPAYFGGSAVGAASAGKGHLVKLCTAVGAVTSLCYMRGISIHFTPVAWKGQLSKDAVEHRIKKLLGEKSLEGVKSHAIDAVGIGLYEQGYLFK